MQTGASRALMILALMLLIPFGVALASAIADVAEPESPPWTPTSQYELLEIRGWPVYVNPELDAHPQLKADTLELLDDHLYRITRKIPQPALDRIRQVKVWVELEMPKTTCMCYHVSRDWLIPNGYNPDKEGGIEVGNAKAFLEWTQGQPWMVLHELAHGFHDQVYGYDDPAIIAAWQNMVDQGDYDEVLHISGAVRRHYGLTNQMEYFAEATESYFGCNDFHPFVKGELMQVDPGGVELMESTWLAYPAVPASPPPAGDSQ